RPWRAGREAAGIPGRQGGGGRPGRPVVRPPPVDNTELPLAGLAAWPVPGGLVRAGLAVLFPGRLIEVERGQFWPARDEAVGIVEVVSGGQQVWVTPDRFPAVDAPGVGP